MIDKYKIVELQKFAARIRIETLKQIGKRGFGHIGGAMSIVDTLSVLYGEIMNIRPKEPKWDNRDWFICSKGHAGPSIYSALALKGYFPIDKLATLNQNGTMLPSHCDRNLTPGIDMTTGSLGQGASAAVGIALGNKMDERDSYVYLVVGDGEMQEGQVWEAILSASQLKLGNLIMFVDNNKQQLDGYTKDINDLGDIKAKLKTFNWHSQEIDGGSIEEIYNAIEKAKDVKDKPSVIVLNTIKGKGCLFAEKILNNHHMTVNDDQVNEALADLENELSALERMAN
ncbi:transketolase [Maledivibacter halophilus]|uniref:Transketolase n=1 Tax=Maledivibacter halophilus TaxID=36842 RepID=A0A1T5M8G6_9FIRM|nr:transketolase [Maledivibacter halophilus]SKC84542.1 transketolase [Maledivibacter halophilus]